MRNFRYFFEDTLEILFNSFLRKLVIATIGFSILFTFIFNVLLGLPVPFKVVLGVVSLITSFVGLINCIIAS